MLLTRCCLHATALSQAYETHELTSFVEDCIIPYVLLAFQDPAPFVQEIQKDGLKSFLSHAVEVHPDCSLGIVVIGLDKYLKAQERLDQRQVSAVAVLSLSAVSQQLCERRV